MTTTEPTDTRDRIKAVALELFTEQGYDATSLREIAERLGVTKAALYYHFKTKDDIVSSFVNDRIAQLDELIAWGRTQPRTMETRRALIRRYSDDLYRGSAYQMMRFMERNQTSMNAHKAGKEMRESLLALLDLLVDPEDPLTDRLRSSLAIFALHSSIFVLRDPEVTDDQRQVAALEVALDLIESRAASRAG